MNPSCFGACNFVMFFYGGLETKLSFGSVTLFFIEIRDEFELMFFYIWICLHQELCCCGFVSFKDINS